MEFFAQRWRQRHLQPVGGLQTTFHKRKQKRHNIPTNSTSEILMPPATSSPAPAPAVIVTIALLQLEPP